MAKTSTNLAGRVVVVTGGAGLLGRSFCAAIAEHGGVAVVADVDLVAAQAAAERIRADGGQAIARPLDTTSVRSLDELISALHCDYGRVHAVVNNAYPRTRNYGRRFEAVAYEDMCDCLSWHLGGYFLAAQRFAEYFKGQSGGVIVNMSSIYGFMAPRFEVYAGTAMTMPIEYALVKAGVVQLTRYIAQYYKGTGIRCNAISPGGIADNQPDSFRRAYDGFCAGKGMLDAADIVGTLIYLVSDSSKYVTGQDIVVDDGYSL